jgi:hypothetical protein
MRVIGLAPIAGTNGGVEGLELLGIAVRAVRATTSLLDGEPLLVRVAEV